MTSICYVCNILVYFHRILRILYVQPRRMQLAQDVCSGSMTVPTYQNNSAAYTLYTSRNSKPFLMVDSQNTMYQQSDSKY